MDGRFLLARARPYSIRLVTISILALAGSLTTLAIPWLAGQFLGVLIGEPNEQIMLIVGLLLAALLLTTALDIVGGIVSADTLTRVLADLRLEAYSHIQNLPLDFHEGHRQGDLLALLTNEVTSLSSFVSTTLTMAPSMLVTAIGSITLLFILDPHIAFIVPVLLPLLIVILRLVGRKQRELGAKARAAESEVLACAEEHLEMISATKAFAMESRQRAGFASRVDVARRLSVMQAAISAATSPVIGLISGFGAIGILLITTQAGAADERSPAELFSILLYAALLTRPVGALAQAYGHYQWAKGTLSRLQSVLDEQVEPLVDDRTSQLATAGAITFDAVSFSYPNRTPLMQHTSFAIAAGETIALTGSNGAGKSTIIKLLLRFYDPTAGRILLDGVDIHRLPLQTLRRQIGFVPQRALLFNGTVRDNIAFGRPGATDDELAGAIRLAQADKFIAQLPEGLETPIGDHGVRLSGGQGQRIALARALLPDPPILVLDEATSMYDLEDELAFVKACRSAFAGRTVIIVTHRPASLSLASRIFRVDHSGVTDITRA